MVHLVEQTVGAHGGNDLKKFTWKTKSGFNVSVISAGASIQAIEVPDKHGVTSDVVLGFDNAEDYISRNTPYFGATVGRCANRIGGATFQIDGTTYQLAKNIGLDHLHGGIVGFDKVNWTSVVDGNKVTFSHLSKDGDEGYPGDLVTNVTYEVTDDDTLHVELLATTTKTTVVNLTNHSYFNLGGHDTGAGELYNHVITINADKITETTAASIPTGKFIKVGGTPYDLRVPTRLGDVMPNTSYDDNYCVSTHGNKDMNFVSRVEHPPSGRYMEIYSDQPGVQLYTSNGLPSPGEPALVGKGGSGYRLHGAFCLETQKFPDAVHHPNFPITFLKPGEMYRHCVSYAFGVINANNPHVVGA